MFTRQIILDSALAVGLVSALSAVFIVDRNKPAPEAKEYAEGEEPPEKRSLIGTNPPVVRKKNQPRADSIYAERVSENRVEVVKKRGGSQLSEKAVKDGLDWLARHQAQEGFWSNRCLGQFPTRLCDKQQPCSGPGGDHPVGQTGLALLAFQGAGHFWFNETEYSSQVKRGIEWLIAQQRQDGAISVGNPAAQGHFMYDHSIATFALAEACATARHSDQQPNRKHFEALEKAVKFLENAQDPYGGGWRYHPRERGDASVSGWVVLALKTAKEAGVKIEPACITKCITFFKECETRSNGRTGYMKGTVITEATTGVGMLVHHFLLEKSDSDLVKAASAYLAGYAEKTWNVTGQGTPDYYLWYNCTLGMYLAGGANWEKWNNIVRKKLEDLQVKNEKVCERGSWPPNDRWGDQGGRIYSTALAVLTLEVYYRFAKRGKGAVGP